MAGTLEEPHASRTEDAPVSVSSDHELSEYPLSDRDDHSQDLGAREVDTPWSQGTVPQQEEEGWQVVARPSRSFELVTRAVTDAVNPDQERALSEEEVDQIRVYCPEITAGWVEPAPVVFGEAEHHALGHWSWAVVVGADGKVHWGTPELVVMGRTLAFGLPLPDQAIQLLTMISDSEPTYVHSEGPVAPSEDSNEAREWRIDPARDGPLGPQ